MYTEIILILHFENLTTVSFLDYLSSLSGYKTNVHSQNIRKNKEEMEVSIATLSQPDIFIIIENGILEPFSFSSQTLLFTLRNKKNISNIRIIIIVNNFLVKRLFDFLFQPSQGNRMKRKR